MKAFPLLQFSRVLATLLEKQDVAMYNSKRNLTNAFRPSHSGVEDGRLCDGLTFCLKVRRR